MQRRDRDSRTEMSVSPDPIALPKGSQRIPESQLLPGLAISAISEALQRTRRMNQGEVVVIKPVSINPVRRQECFFAHRK